MKVQVTQLGGLLGAGAAIGTTIYAVKTNKAIGKALLFVAIAGVAGVLLGNAITKFYE